jgi:hypothetical protein
MPSGLRSLASLATLFSLLALAGAGCSSPGKPASASFASVVIKGHTAQEIAGATVQVFGEAGYAGGVMGGNQLMFQREGSKMTNLAYEGAVGSFYGAQTLVRVKAEIVSLGGDMNRLQCQAYVVKGAGDAFFEEETRLTRLKAGPYRSLLNKVAERLNQPRP